MVCSRLCRPVRACAGPFVVYHSIRAGRWLPCTAIRRFASILRLAQPGRLPFSTAGGVRGEEDRQVCRVVRPTRCHQAGHNKYAPLKLCLPCQWQKRLHIALALLEPVVQSRPTQLGINKQGVAGGTTAPRPTAMVPHASTWRLLQLLVGLSAPLLTW